MTSDICRNSQIAYRFFCHFAKARQQARPQHIRVFGRMQAKGVEGFCHSVKNAASEEAAFVFHFFRLRGESITR